MSLKSILENKLKRLKENNALPTLETSLKLEEEYYEKYLVEFGLKSNDKKLRIPKFFTKPPDQNDLLRQQFREETASHLLKRRSQQLLDNVELQELWMLLDQNQSFPEEQLMTYSDFKKVSELASLKIRHYFIPSTFAKLIQDDPQGRILTMSLFNYVMRKVWLEQTRIGLSLYDTSGQGYLSENGLENYITDLIPSVPQLEGLEESFKSFYVCTAVRKFLFFLDLVRGGRVRILDILASSFLDSLLELRDESLSKEYLEQNWFSASSALRVYGHYLNLDKDHNGMLSKSELAGYGSGTLTQPFLDRVFQTCLTYGGEMDYKTYLDLVLALENRQEPQSIAFLFRIVDIKDQRYLDAFTLSYFFRAIQEQARAHGSEPVPFNDVKDELFDMVKPKNPDRITLEDLLACGQGDTFISILIEYHGFWAYENREAVTAEPTLEN